MSWRRRIAALTVTGAGVLAAAGMVASGAPAGAAPAWQRVWSTTFPVSAPLGTFRACDRHVASRAASCAGLPAPVRAQWWAYPAGWPDTATERHYRVGGFYDPATTVWISHRMLHIRLWRGGGPVHSAALLPRAAMGALYGKFVERWRVVRIARGYKSAHMLWPVGRARNEVDFPENDWNTQPYAYVHYGPGDRQLSYGSGVRWGSWHTSVIVWTPRYLAFYIDGRQIGRTTAGVPHVRMDWILQNETALDGEVPAPHSSAQMDISYVAVYRLR